MAGAFLLVSFLLGIQGKRHDIITKRKLDRNSDVLAYYTRDMLHHIRTACTKDKKGPAIIYLYE